MRRGRFPRNYWTGPEGLEHARVSMIDLVRELKLESAAAYLLFIAITHDCFRQRGLRGMLQGVYRGSNRAAIDDYLQTTRSQPEAVRGPKAAATPPLLPAHRLELRLLGGVEVGVDGERISTLEHSGRLLSVLCLLALHRSGVRPDRIATLLREERSTADLMPCSLPRSLPRSLPPPVGSDDVYASRVDVPRPMQCRRWDQRQGGLARTSGSSGVNRVTHNVRQMVYRIRQEAGWHDIVVSQTEGGIGETTYRLPDGTWCDIWEFEAKLAQADQHSVRSDDPHEAEVAFVLRREAIELYRGGMECEFGETWKPGKPGTSGAAELIAHAASRLRDRYVEALFEQAVFWQRVALMHWGKRNTEGTHTGSVSGVNEEDALRHALRHYLEAVRGDPYNEAAYVGAMRCHARLGNWAKVQQVFESCRRVLSSQLGAAPSKTTFRAYEELAALCGGQIPGTDAGGDRSRRLNAYQLLKSATTTARATNCAPMVPTVEDAILLATEAYRSQKDRAGEPFILHALRVMLRIEPGPRAPHVRHTGHMGHLGHVDRMAAVLHDVLERSFLTLEDVRRAGYPQEVLDSLECMTPQPGEPYDVYIERVRLNPLAARIALADLDDKIDLDRMPDLNSREMKRLEKHLRARISLQKELQQEKSPE